MLSSVARQSGNSTLESADIVLSDMHFMRMYLRDRSGHEVRDWVSTEVRGLQRHISCLNHLHNSTLPLQTMPEDVLVEVLRRVVFTQSDKTWLIQAASVCRYWRETIWGTALLWNDINLGMKLRHIELCLARSFDACLRVRLYGGFVDAHALSVACSLLAAHQSRISTINLNLASYSLFRQDSRLQSVCRIIEAFLPKLESMTIVSCVGVPLQLTESHLPNLRKLSLSGVTLEWTSWPLRSLTSLGLSEIMHSRGDEQSQDDLNSLLDVLEACHLLESLTYEQRVGTTASPELHSSNLDERVVFLPCLQYLSVKVVTMEDAAAILTHVELPEDASVSVYVAQAGLSPHLSVSPLTAVLSPGGTLLPILARARHIAVSLAGIELNITAEESLPVQTRGFASSSREDRGPTPMAPVLS